MKALVFEAPEKAVVADLDRPADRARRGAGPIPRRRHLPLGLRAATPGATSSPCATRSSRATSGRVRSSRPAPTWPASRSGDRVVGECVVGPEGRDHFGFSISGANAEYFRARGEWLHVLPDELCYEAGALVEPFSVAYNATHSAGGLDPADQVAVIGGGPIGLLCVAAAAAHNATVTLIEPQQSRRAAALDLGARRALDPSADDFADAVAEHTHGRGFDVVLEAAGKPAAMAMALELAAHSARLVYIGIAIGTTAPAQLGLIQSKALRITGIIGSAGLWPRTIRFLASGVVDPTAIVTARFPLVDALAALDAAQDTAANVKVHIQTA